MKAPRPLTSPSAQMPGTLVRSSSSTVDEAARVGGDAGLVEAQVVGVRIAADGQQQVRAGDRRAAPARSSRCTTTPSPRLSQRQALGVERGTRCLRASRIACIAARPRRPRAASRRGAISTTVTRAAEAPVHLRELEADVAAADDDQVLGQEVDVHHAGVGEDTARRRARRVGHRRPAADVDEDLRRLRAARPSTPIVRGLSKRPWP